MTTRDVILNRRLSERIPFRNKIKYGFWGSVWVGNTANLSEGGIGIKANRAFPPGSKIVALLYVDDKIIELEGIVAWVSPLPETLPAMALSTMGIKFSSQSNDIKSIYQQRAKLSVQSSTPQVQESKKALKRKITEDIVKLREDIKEAFDNTVCVGFDITVELTNNREFNIRS